MSDILIGDAIGAGFGLIRRRPLDVLLWGLLQTTILVVVVAVMSPLYIAMFAATAQGAAAGRAAAPTDLAAINQMSGANFVMNFVQIFAATVLNCAVLRAVIHPDRSRFAYLRLGGVELTLFAMIIGGFIAGGLGLFTVMLPVGLIVGALVAFNAGAAAVIVGILLGFALVAGLVYVFLRLTMIAPMMVDDGQVHFLDAWALTKGKAGSLFLVALGLFAILLVVELVVIIFMLVAGAGALSGVAGGVQAIPALLKQPPAALISTLTPFFAAAGVIAIPLYGVVLAIAGAPWAKAYLDLRKDPAAEF